MSMLARYKKGGGIIELVKMIEDSGEPKRSQLLKMIREEDAEFAQRVESRLFSYEMFKTLPEELVAEIIAANVPKIIALALYGESDKDFVTLVERCLGKNFSEYKSEKEAIIAEPANVTQVDSARKKIIAEARKLEADGKIKLPFSEVAEGAAENGGNKMAVPGGGPTGTANEESGCPPTETFGIEAPPPGLAGERLETFFKSQLER